MKALLASIVIAAAALPAFAQVDAAVNAERARIGAERRQAEARFAEQEVACYRKFGVNDCLNAARSERRQRLSELRRQELALNEAERKRRAEERVRSIEERNSERAREEGAAKRADTVARQREKQEDLEKRAAERAQKHPAGTTGAVRVSSEPRPPRPAVAPRVAAQPRGHDTAEALRQHGERLKEAQERRDRVAKRQAEAAKAPLKPLPVPP